MLQKAPGRSRTPATTTLIDAWQPRFVTRKWLWAAKNLHFSRSTQKPGFALWLLNPNAHSHVTGFHLARLSGSDWDGSKRQSPANPDIGQKIHRSSPDCPNITHKMPHTPILVEHMLLPTALHAVRGPPGPKIESTSVILGCRGFNRRVWVYASRQ